MKQFPKQFKFKKVHQPNTTRGLKGRKLTSYTIGLRMFKANLLSYTQLETFRRVIIRNIKPKERRNKKNLKNQVINKSKSKRKRSRRRKYSKALIIRSTLTIPVTQKPLQTRMGKGKGAIDHWVYTANKSRVLFEMSRKYFTIRRINKLFLKVRNKIPSKCRIVFQRNTFRKESLKRYRSLSLKLFK